MVGGGFRAKSGRGSGSRRDEVISISLSSVRSMMSPSVFVSLLPSCGGLRDCARSMFRRGSIASSASSVRSIVTVCDA